MIGDDEILWELKRIHALLKVAFADQIDVRLRKFITTEDRRRIWASIDGKLTASEISGKLAIPKRTVDFFLSVAEEVGLVVAPRGKPPLRLLEVLPHATSGPKKADLDTK